MKKTRIILITALLTVAAAMTSAMAQNREGRRGGHGCDRPASRGHCQMMNALPEKSAEALTEEEINMLQTMLEEEKLAGDVYQALEARWNDRRFTRIGSAENRHQSHLQLLAERYGLASPDDQLPAGEFEKEGFTRIYKELVERGNSSFGEALQVGALIEEMDIADLRKSRQLTDKADILFVLDRLEDGSIRHFQAYYRGLQTLDLEYQPSHLSTDDIAGLLAADTGKGQGQGHGHAYGYGRKGHQGQGHGRGHACGQHRCKR